MKLHKVPARTGFEWVKQGMRTFFRQPLALAGLFFMFMLLVSLLSVIPILGQFLSLALLPAATLGLMAATREASGGKFPMPTILATAFRAGQSRAKAMAILGGLYAIGSVVVMLLAGVLSGVDMQTLASQAESAEALMMQPDVVNNLFISLALYLPLGLLFWHAPALVHWHGISPGKSLFFSALACWTNKAALVVFFFAWMAVFLGFAMAIVMIAMLLGGPSALGVVAFPVVMLLSAMFFSSLYFTFRDSFVTDDGQAPA